MKISTLLMLLKTGAVSVASFTIKSTPRKYASATISKTTIHSQAFSLENPTIGSNQKSLSGTSYADVISGLSVLYPPEELSTRNALSRTDGYWKYVAKGEEPPQTLIYGEFDVLFFADLMDKALSMHNEGSIGNSPISEKTFLDIGSGTGRLVVGASALHPTLKLCRGLEILPGIHEKALESLDMCKSIDGSMRLSPQPNSHDRQGIPLAPICFDCGSFSDPYQYFGDADVIFVFSTCFSAEMMSSLSDGIARQCKPGTIIITTEYKLNTSGTIAPLSSDPTMPSGEYEIDLVNSIDGQNWLVGGVSTAHIHRLTKSLWDGKGARTRPSPSHQDEMLKEAKEALEVLAPRQLSFEEFLKSQ